MDRVILDPVRKDFKATMKRRDSVPRRTTLVVYNSNNINDVIHSGVSAPPMTDALYDICTLQHELTELGQKFDGMWSLTDEERLRMSFLRGEIARLWERRRVEVATVRRGFREDPDTFQRMPGSRGPRFS